MARPREFDEQRVLATAREEFWSTGYAGTSMDAVSAATGLGKGSLYGAFGGKRELFHRVFDDYCTAAVSSVAAQLDGGDEGALDRLTACLLDHARSSARPGHRACLLAKGAAELAERDPVVSVRSQQAFEALRLVFAGALEAGQRAGDLERDADVPRLAGLLLAVHRGIEALAEAGLDEETLSGIAQTALDGLPRAGSPPVLRGSSRS